MKARKDPTITIDEGTDGEGRYRLKLWPTSDSFEWQFRLSRMGLEAAAAAIANAGREWSDLGEADFAEIARTIIRCVEREGLAPFMRALLEGVSILEEGPSGKEVAIPLTGKGGGYETRYAGRSMHLYKLAGWVIRENLADFIPAVAWIGEALDRLKSSESNDDSGTEATA